jgi:hypothetical protein
MSRPSNTTLLTSASSPEVRTLPSAGITRLPRYYDPFRTPPTASLEAPR